jgi:very-short-patch-repair endonuclease
MHLHPEVMLQRIAARQHSVFSRRQAIDAGISEKTIDRYLRSGRWVRLHAGVYLPSVVPITWKQRMAAALLACGPDAVSSHRGAIAVWGWDEDLFLPEVTVPNGTRRTHEGIRVHRAQALEVALRRGFRVTRPMRTLVDLASCVAENCLERLVDDAHRNGLICPDRLKGYLSLPTNIPRPGTGVLREIVEARVSGEANDSRLESDFFAALRRCRVPLPVSQHPVLTRAGKKYIDFSYPDRMVASELHGWKHHGTRVAFELDRARRNELELLGWHVLQFTWRLVQDDPIGVAMTVAIALGLVPSRWRLGTGR